MASPLRLQAITLTAPDVAAVARFYRWVLQLRAGPEGSDARIQPLGWGKEDRVRVVDAVADAAAEDAVTLRMPALATDAVAAWCGERELDPAAVGVGPAERDIAAALWPNAEIVVIEDPAARNRTELVVRGPADARVELVFPLPGELLARRGELGPFYWRSGDWRGLEIPGLLGVTTGAPDPTAFRVFLGRLGVGPLDADAGDGPLGVGDHQWIVEERARLAIVGFAVVVSATRIADLKRTLEHLGADHRHEGNRLLAADPGGRFVLVSGVHHA